MSNTYRELRVWQKAVDLAVLVYEFTAEFPKHELYGLSSQMRRAAVSVASNLAEGAARGTRKDFRHFVKLAEGSNSELQTQLLIARRLKFGCTAASDTVDELSNDVGKMLTALSNYLTREIRLTDST